MLEEFEVRDAHEDRLDEADERELAFPQTSSQLSVITGVAIALLNRRKWLEYAVFLVSGVGLVMSVFAYLLV